MVIVVLSDGLLVVLEPVILTEAEYEDEMREAGSRRFVPQTDPFCPFPSAQDIPRLLA